MIIGAGVVLYMISNYYNEIISAGVIIMFYLLLPFLIYKTLRFYAHNSAYRNVRFRFQGNSSESYKVYLLFGILIPLTLGLILPYWVFRQKKYFFSNMDFGTTSGTFDGKHGPFYKAYFVVSMFMLGAGIISAIGMAPAVKDLPSPETRSVIYLLIFGIYIAMAVIFVLIQQYFYARLNNYCWNQFHLGAIRFESTLKARELMWIRLTNILSILFSFGIMIPWAKIRRTRYILDNLTVIADGSLDNFTAATESDISAIGDTATDFFDIEIGL